MVFDEAIRVSSFALFFCSFRLCTSHCVLYSASTLLVLISPGAYNYFRFTCSTVIITRAGTAWIL
ncbi:hypothetical protein KXD40_003493 [Peronospora effusa]|nr:hypothetical protein KXD40_003493 [Peronospora effusa]